MMQITEDTPPDMLAGAMDLTVHLPNGQPPVKMAVDRSTPMMDLLVQVTTAHRLQPSAHIIQALGCAPNQNQSDAILPYKPNTPIGALDTQHIKVIPKSPSKTLSKTSSLPNTNRAYTQPFESTFRLQVHLPRNQLYVVRVSQHVMLEDIMKKVCTEKNLDEKKYEFRHPGNLQEILDPKLTLSDYQLTEVSVVQKGRAVSVSDMAALQREEERRRQQSRSGGGVFNLIFKRGRTGVSTGSVSSGDTRSISPTRSDDSHTRSETPPAIQSTQILQNVKQEQMSMPPAQDKPKVPLRKRRPAPKPPVQQQNNETTVPVQKTIIIKDAPEIKNNTFNDNSNIKTQATSNSEKSITDNNGLTICHSRNSSDSSGYHEASILSDNFNTQTLSRRNKNNLTASTSNINQMGNGMSQSGECSKSTSNLAIMENHSKSTSNLVTTVQRKKKAPPPPPLLKSSESTANLEKQQMPTTLPTTVTNTAPVVASAKPIAPPVSAPPKPIPRSNLKINPNDTGQFNEDIPPKPKPRLKTQLHKSISISEEHQIVTNNNNNSINCTEVTKSLSIDDETNIYLKTNEDAKKVTSSSVAANDVSANITDTTESADLELSTNNNNSSCIKISSTNNEPVTQKNIVMSLSTNSEETKLKNDSIEINEESELMETSSVGSGSRFRLSDCTASNIQKSLQMINSDVSKNSDVSFRICDSEENDDFEICDLNMFDNKQMKKILKRQDNINEEKSFHNLRSNTDTDLADMRSVKNELLSTGSLKSMDSIPAFPDSSNMKKWSNFDHLDGVSLTSDCQSVNRVAWSLGEISDTDSVTNVPAGNIKTPRISDLSMQPPSACPSPPPSNNSCDSPSRALSNAVSISPKSTEKHDQMSTSIEVKALTPPAEFKNSPLLKDTSVDSPTEVMDMDWQYQLPSPPKAFRDSSPTNLTEITNYETVTLNGFKSDSTVVSTPELIEKLEVIRDNQTETFSKQTSETSSQLSEDHSSENIGSGHTLLSGHLSLEELEKRKSQFLEKELASLNHEVIQKNITHKISLEEISDQKRNDLLHELEGKLQNGNKTVSRNNSLRQDKIVQKESESILPNFKITTYNQSKKGINIFEDDSIRSNVENKTDTLKKETDLIYKQKKSSGISERDINVINAMNEQNIQKSFDKPNIISYREKSDNEIFKIPNEIPKQKSSQISINGYNADKSVQRSDSFHSSKNDLLNGYKQNPVKRSVSHVSLDKYKFNGTDDAAQNPEPIRKTSSQWNVSDLQSLQVMRAILPKLTNSQPSSPTIEEPKVEPKLDSQVTKPVEQSTSKEVKYRYSPPSINLTTWSERPKSQVSLKSDKDYRIGGAGTANEYLNVGSKTVNADNSSDVVDSSKINIKINNNCEASSKISHHIDGNVVIKIGGNNECANSNFTKKSTLTDPAAVTIMRFIDHTTATGFKKTDCSYSKPPRPHSIAFDSYQDMSRVPVVRAVELKKSFRDPQTSGNKSITQIIPDECGFSKSNTLGRNVNGFHNSSDSLHLNGNNSNTLPYKSSLNSLGNKKRFSEIYSSSEMVNITNEPKVNCNNNAYTDVHPTADNMSGLNKYGSNENTVNVFGHKSIIKNNRISAPVPVVKGFRLQHTDKLTVQSKHENINNFSKFTEKSNQNETIHTNGKSENVSKQLYSYAPKPFSQATLKKTVYSEKLTNESSQNNSRPVINNVNKFSTIPSKPNNAAPVPPPPMPKVTAVMKKVPRDCTVDPRDQLLDAIRNFGGKSSLKPIK